MKITPPLSEVDLVGDSINDVPPEQVDEPSPADWAMVDLTSAVGKLAQDIPYGYDKQLDEAIAELGAILEIVRKPF